MLKRPDASVAFLRDKPANGLRVFFLGESSVFGFPFGPELAFARFLYLTGRVTDDARS